MVKTMSNPSSIIQRSVVEPSWPVSVQRSACWEMERDHKAHTKKRRKPHRQVQVVVAEVSSRVRRKATKGRQVRGTHKCSLLLKSRQARMMGKEPVSTENSDAAT